MRNIIDSMKESARKIVTSRQERLNNTFELEALEKTKLEGTTCVFMKFKIEAKEGVPENVKDILLEVTKPLSLIVGSLEKIHEKELQQIFRELPRFYEFEESEDGELYMKSYRLYNLLYLACMKANLANEESYLLVIEEE